MTVLSGPLSSGVVVGVFGSSHTYQFHLTQPHKEVDHIVTYMSLFCTDRGYHDNMFSFISKIPDSVKRISSTPLPPLPPPHTHIHSLFIPSGGHLVIDCVLFSNVILFYVGNYSFQTTSRSQLKVIDSSCEMAIEIVKVHTLVAMVIADNYLS